MTANVVDSSTKKIAVGGVQAIHAMLSMVLYPPTKDRGGAKPPLPARRARGGGGVGLSTGSDSRPGPLTRRFAPTSPRKRGEVKLNPEMCLDRVIIRLHPAKREAARDVIADKPDHQRAGDDGQNAGRSQQAPIH